MAENIKPGDLQELPDDYTAFDFSMAAKIEEELNRLLVLDGLPQLPGDDEGEVRDRRRFIVAIARGIVLHLQERNEAFVIDLTGDPTTVHPTIAIE